ncbi:MAG: hypothetical protein H5T62_12910 [Anaerolineae bacterium]|nr:hypothetical protein [Anaerolineae bacterium]
MAETIEQWYFSLGWLLAILAAFYVTKVLLLEFAGHSLMSIPIINTLFAWLLALVMLPGTIVHEVCHFVAATFLFVKVTNVSFTPKLTDGGLSLGRVQFAKKPDPFRDALIGIAPLIGGSAILVPIVAWGFSFPMPSYFLGVSHLVTELSALRTNIDPSSTRDLIVLWLLFSIGNSVFPSKSDRRAWGLAGILIVLLGGALWYFVGLSPSDLLVRLPLSVLEIVNMTIFALTLVLLIDLALLTPVLMLALLLLVLAGRRRRN